MNAAPMRPQIELIPPEVVVLTTLHDHPDGLVDEDFDKATNGIVSNWVAGLVIYRFFDWGFAEYAAGYFHVRLSHRGRLALAQLRANPEGVAQVEIGRVRTAADYLYVLARKSRGEKPSDIAVSMGLGTARVGEIIKHAKTILGLPLWRLLPGGLSERLESRGIRSAADVRDLFESGTVPTDEREALLYWLEIVDEREMALLGTPHRVCDFAPQGPVTIEATGSVPQVK